jgi:hypothetical protein
MIRSNITPELAQQDSSTFKRELVEHMGRTTELGAAAWNLSIEQETVNPSLFQLNTDSWVSQSSGSGHLILGTAPMTDQEKERYLFEGEQLSYPDEVSRRLLHEIGHGGLFLAQRDPQMHSLRQTATDIRRQTGGEQGLSAIGSHPFYETPSDKGIEDTVELVTMRIKGANHLHDYLAFLADPRYQAVIESHGLVMVEDSDYLREAIENAVTEIFAK